MVKKIYSNYRRQLILTFIMATLVSLSIIPYPFVMKAFIDRVIPNKDMNEVMTWSGILVLIIVVRMIANFLQNYTLAKVEGNFERDLRLTIFEKILKLPMSFFVSNDTGTLMSRVLNDSSNSSGLFRDYYLVLYSSILSIAAAVVSMLYLDWVLTLLCLLILPVLFIVTSIVNAKMAKESQKMSSASSACSSELKESLDAIETVKVDHLYARVGKNFKRAVDNYLKINVAINKYGAMAGGIMTGIVSFAPILVFILGTFRVINEQTSIGNVVAISSLIVYLFMPIQEIALSKIKMQRPKAMWKKIGELLNEKEEVLSGSPVSGFGLKLEDVSFAYDNRNKIFEKMNLTINPGQMVGIAGQTGGGKSTLYKLIAKFYDISAGRFFIENEAAERVSTDELRKKMAYINRNTYIFNGTVRENIALGKDISDSEIQAALRIACLNDAFQLDSAVGTEGKAISDGQRVRLAIARAVVKNPSIFLIDEALTALDPLTEAKIITNLRERFSDATFIVISHRESVFKYMDRIFVLEDRKFSEGFSFKEAQESEAFTRLFSVVK
ncbi:MAG TPA: ABC transporter ATP-binding protein [Thermotogota bacterium]|nr:ABC transporter ATP-binding protein [Thermotogota bacterium]HPJ88330.1 ABC transporter ATP-binding protein [Thermotogota bacterium]HPR97424.1 ABC transporter ATP-binding protein [Thermotogota bacterium]